MVVRLGYRGFIHLQVAGALCTIASVACHYIEGGVPGAALRTAPLYGLPLALAVFMVMWARGCDPDLAQGYRASPRPPSLEQAFLQNTVEQTLLAVLAAVSFHTFAPSSAAGLLFGAGYLFAAGRLLFLAGYGVSPSWRFYGFALNFYTSAGLLAASVWYALCPV